MSALVDNGKERRTFWRRILMFFWLILKSMLSLTGNLVAVVLVVLFASGVFGAIMCGVVFSVCWVSEHCHWLYLSSMWVLGSIFVLVGLLAVSHFLYNKWLDTKWVR